MDKSIQNAYGSSAMQVGAVVGGAVLGNFAQKKVAFLSSTFGRLILIVIGILLVAKSKSDTVKSIGMGVSCGAGMGFLGALPNNPLGINAVSGLGDVGQVVQDANGMLYMVNGLGELEPYDGYELNGVDGDYDDYEPVNGVDGDYDDYYEPVNGIDEAMAAA